MFKKNFFGFGLGKITLLFFIFNLIIGLLLGIIFFIFLRMSIIALEIINIPFFGLFLLSFILIPLGFAVLGAVLGFLIVLILNLILKIIRGVDVYFKGEDSSLPVLNETTQSSQNTNIS